LTYGLIKGHIHRSALLGTWPNAILLIFRRAF
jgi:hypothetical protein